MRAAWAYAAALFLAFPFMLPQQLGGLVVDGGWLFAWCAPALLLHCVRGLAPARAARRAFLFSLLGYGAVLHWITVVTVDYGHAPLWVGLLAPFGLALWPALFAAAFAAGAARFLQHARNNIAAPLVLAAWWVALDHARSFLFGGFTWAQLGYALHNNEALLGIAQYAGVYGLTFIAVFASFCALNLIHTNKSSAQFRGALIGLALVALTHAAGVWLQPNSASWPQMRVAVLQGNVAQGEKWNPARLAKTLADYETQTRAAAADGAELIVWPETALPANLNTPEWHGHFANLAREVNARLVIGAPAVEWRAESRRPYVYDSAFLFAPNVAAHNAPRYDKTKLVPFGEFLPLRWLLEGLLRPLATGISNHDLSAGEEVRALEFPALKAGAAPLRVGVAVCYELIFPDSVRRFSKDGARILLGITNDAWYGRSGAPWQFLAITKLRAAENGSALARAANTGVSALIDEKGRIQQQSGLFTRTALVGDVRLRPPQSAPTFYAAHGNVFATLCWSFSALAIAALLLARFQKGRNDERRK